MYNGDLKINRTLQKIMIDKGIKNNDIAAICNKSNQVVSNQLKKQTNLTIATIDEIAHALECSIKLQFIDKDSGKVIECE